MTPIQEATCWSDDWQALAQAWLDAHARGDSAATSPHAALILNGALVAVRRGGVVQETAVPVADISAMTKVQAEYDSLLERWHAAYAGSQEIADLHATFKARAQGVGRLVENGLFKRILAALAPTPPAVEAPNPKGQTK